MDGHVELGAYREEAATAVVAGDTKVSTAASRGEHGYSRRVTWIDWDSGFRGSGLKVGDRIVGAAGRRYTEEDADKHLGIGDAHEGTFWSELGLGDGNETTVFVEGAGGVVTITGRLAGHRNYRGEDGKRRIGDDGPVQHDKDGFQYAWWAWYKNLMKLAETVLAGWDYTVGYDSRRYQTQVEEYRPRVVFLGQTYPGRFAAAVREDFDAMVAMLAGESRIVRDADLEYRSLGERRAAQVTAAADAAFDAFVAEMGDDLVDDPFPAPHPFQEDIMPVVGKMVLLPEAGRRDLLFEIKHSWYRFGRYKGNYLVDRHDPAMQPVYAAIDRYAEKVNPFFRRSRLRFVGIIEPRVALVSDAIRNITVVGLWVRPIAALFTDDDDREKRFFIDLDTDRNPSATFAGEADLLALDGLALDDAKTPADVMRVYVDSFKRADIGTWRACYADWKVRATFKDDDRYLYVDRTWIVINDQYAASLWDKSRQRLLDDVYAAEVAQVSPARVVYDADRQPSGVGDEDDPRIVEEVRVIVNHVGKFEGGYRTFASATLKRKWTLQRLDDGPWRIVDAQGL